MKQKPPPLYKHTQPTTLLIGMLIKQTPSQFPGHTWSTFVAGAGTFGLPVYQDPTACSILWGPTSFPLVPSPSHLHCLSHLLSGMCSGRVYLCSEAESSRIKSSHMGPILAHTCIHTQRHTHSPGYPHSHLCHYIHILALVDHMHTHRLVPKIDTHLSRPKYIPLLPRPICEVSFLGGPIFVEVEEIRKHRDWM